MSTTRNTFRIRAEDGTELAVTEVRHWQRAARTLDDLGPSRREEMLAESLETSDGRSLNEIEPGVYEDGDGRRFTRVPAGSR